MTESEKPTPFARKPCNCGKKAPADGGRRMVAPAPRVIDEAATFNADEAWKRLFKPEEAEF